VWLAVVAAHALGADLVVLLAVVLATAYVFDSAGSAIDRLMVALGFLAGVTCLGGLLLSVWPWHLHPVALGGGALSVLAVTITIRRPQRFSIRLRATDAAALAGVLGCALVISWPTVGRSLAQRLALVIRGEDLARHFAIYDEIRGVGGYLFLHHASAGGVVTTTELGYPQGGHLLTAVVDNFVTSSARRGDSIAALSRFLVYYQLWYVLLGAAVIWAARRLGGARLTGATMLLVSAAAVGLVGFGVLLTVYLVGFLAEIAGLVMLALLAALTARPLHRPRQHLAAVAALVIALAFSYYIFLPFAAAGLITHVIVYRRRLWPARWFAVALLAVTAAACVVPRIAAGAEDSLSLRLLLQDFGALAYDRTPVVILGTVVVGASLVLGWRLPAARVHAVSVLAAAGLVAAFGAYELSRVHKTTYFFEKFLHAAIVIVLVGLGFAVPALLRPLRLATAHWPARPVIAGVTAAILAVASVGIAGGIGHAAAVDGDNPATGTGWGRLYLMGGAPSYLPPAEAALRVAAHVPDPDGVLTLVSMSGTGFLATLYVSVLQRDYARTRIGYLLMFSPMQPRRLLPLARAYPGLQVVVTDPTELGALQAARLAGVSTSGAAPDVALIDLAALGK
jgi:hypothetical protein